MQLLRTLIISQILGKRRQDALLRDLSEISATDFDETIPNFTSKANVLSKNNKDHRHLKPHYKQKKKRDIEPRNVGCNKRDVKKKAHRKKKCDVKVISESSEESDDEYRNKRRKLANAVIVHRASNDKSSLQARLQKMINGTKHPEPTRTLSTEEKLIETDIHPKVEEIVQNDNCISNLDFENQKEELIQDIRLPDEIIEIEDTQRICDLIDLCTQDDVAIVNRETQIDTVDLVNEQSQDTVDSVNEKPQDSVFSLVPQVSKDDVDGAKTGPAGDSDEDLELLRQHALKTKASKPKPMQKNVPTEHEIKQLASEDEDSDTTELRLICLKSALLKKAIEMKRKQKLQKRLSQSSNLQDELYNEQEDFLKRIDAENNNTDIESVDMDIGSDGDEKGKEVIDESSNHNNGDQVSRIFESNENKDPKIHATNDDEFDEDEDLLRARLLTSLSKNLPNLVDPTIITSIDKPKKEPPKSVNKNVVNNVPEEKRIIINLGESDSEGEHEATKNLTKMHLKLSEQVDFQQKLDMFLKSTRMEVEKEKLPDIEDKSSMPKTPQKFVAKVRIPISIFIYSFYLHVIINNFT